MLGDKDEEKIKLWFTRKGHHRNASVVYITQNLFQQSKSSRTISLNAHYLVLIQSPRDKMQIKVLANQLQAPHMIHAFNDATSIPHGYLLVDLKPNTPDYLRFRTQIFQNWFTNQINKDLLSIFQEYKKVCLSLNPSFVSKWLNEHQLI